MGEVECVFFSSGILRFDLFVLVMVFFMIIKCFFFSICCSIFLGYNFLLYGCGNGFVSNVIIKEVSKLGICEE